MNITVTTNDPANRHRRTFVLRVWAEPNAQALVWRYRLEAVTVATEEGERVWTFASLAALTAFLESQEARP